MGILPPTRGVDTDYPSPRKPLLQPAYLIFIAIYMIINRWSMILQKNPILTSEGYRQGVKSSLIEVLT